MKGVSLIRVLGAIALVLPVLLGACSESAPQLLEQARGYALSGDRARAIERLRKAIERSSTNAEAHLLLGTIYAQGEEVAEAEAELRRARELGAPAARVEPELGRLFLLTQRYQQLLDELVPAFDMPEQSLAEIYLLRGRAHLALGGAEDAEAQYHLAASGQPEQAKLGLARVAALQGNLVVATRFAREVLDASPDRAEAWNVAGDLRRIASDPAGARDAYRKALELEPRNTQAAVSLAILEVQAGRPEAAAQLLENAPPAPMVHFARAVLAFREGRPDESREALGRVLRMLPRHTPSTLLGAVLAFQRGDLDEAQGLLIGFIGHFPRDVYARKLLAATLLRKGQFADATRVLRPIVPADGADPELLGLLGRSQLGAGQLEEARALLQKATGLDPVHAPVRTDLGLAKLSTGDRAGGLSDLEAAARLDPAQHRADVALVGALLALGEVSGAERAARAIEQRAPRLPAAHQLVAAVKLAQQDKAGARAAFDRALGLERRYLPAAAGLAQMDLREAGPAAARARLEKFLSSDPGNVAAVIAIADLDLAEGRQAEAVSLLRRAALDHPRAARVQLRLAQELMAAGVPEDARLAAQLASDIDPADPWALEVLGRAQQATGDPVGAMVAFRRMTSLMPDSAAGWVQLASAYAAADDPLQAEASLRKALSIDADDLEAAIALGVMWLDQGRAREARDLAAGLQKRFARMPHGYALEADAQMSLGQHEAAARAYARAIEVQDAGALQVGLHQARTQAAGAFASPAGLLAWLKDHPGEATTRLYLADALLAAGRNREAAEQYELLLAADPRQARVLNNLAWALHREGDPRALEFAQRAFLEEPGNALIADTMGSVLVAVGKPQDAVRYLNIALTHDAQSVPIRLHLAQAMARMGDTEGARRELQRVVEAAGASPEAVEAREMLARLGR